MCGRYTLTTTDHLKRRFDTANSLPKSVGPNYNAAPTQHMPVIVRKDGKNRIEIMHWGLIPVWAKDKPRFGYAMINARAESILEKPMWKGLVKKKRCLVPATGFYEWQKDGKEKQPFFIHLKDRELFAMAGVYDAWTDKDTGEVFGSFSIITTAPNEKMKKVHDRMPVILNQDEESVWLDESLEEHDIMPMLDPYSVKNFELYTVSKDVNSVKNNNPDLTYPIDLKE